MVDTRALIAYGVGAPENAQETKEMPRGNYSCGHPIKKNVSAAELTQYKSRQCKDCRAAADKTDPAVRSAITEMLAEDAAAQSATFQAEPEPSLAGDPDAQQADSDTDTVVGALFDTIFDGAGEAETDTPSTADVIELPVTDVLEATVQMDEGTPTLVDLAVKLQTGDRIEVPSELPTLKWAPGAFLRSRSRNRQTATLVGVYDLEHPDNTSANPLYVGTPKATDGQKPLTWATRCETHGSIFYGTSVNTAWDMRAAPWGFCGDCKAIHGQKAGSGQVLAVGGSKKGTTVIDAKPKGKGKAKNAPKAEVAASTPPPPPEAVANDPEAKVWERWSQEMSAASPAGSSVDWLNDYHYQVALADNRLIDVRVDRVGTSATFKHDADNGKLLLADDLPAILKKMGVRA